MIHIILTILKTAGILLLILIGLILFAVLSALLVPLRYSGQGKRESGRLEGRICVSWFLHLVHFTCSYREEKAEWDIRIFGISLRKLGRLLEKRQRRRRRKVAKPDSPEEKIGKEPTQVPEIQEKAEIPEPEEGFCPVPAKRKQEKAEEKLCLWEKGERVLGKFFRAVSGVGKAIWRILRSIALFPVKVCRRIEKICFTIDGICDKIEKWKRFARDPHTREAWNLIKGSLGRILHHVLPGKIKGKILFGFANPSATGQFLAAVSPFYPLYGKQLSLIPAFDREVLEGEVRFSGRIYGIFFLKTALKIWMDKNIKITIKRFRRMGNA